METQWKSEALQTTNSMPMDAERIAEIRMKYAMLAPAMDERQTRLWAAAEALALGRGGAAAVTKATGIRGKRLWKGKRDLEGLERDVSDGAQGHRVRRPGGGRKSAATVAPALLSELEKLVAPTTRGDPMSPLRWTTKGLRTLAGELTSTGYNVSPKTVSKLLRELGYSLQATRKTVEGKQHADRDAQFKYINRQTRAFQRSGKPVISVDTKKKELIGSFANKGREWQPKKKPERVRVHDFPSDAEGKAIPYGVYDVNRNEGWVSVGVDHDTGAFAVSAIRAWWRSMGSTPYAETDELYIVADAGGSNSYRNRLWKSELQKFSDDTGLQIRVSHMPPGTSKWNKIEHRLFSHISQNWRGRPLVDYETVVNLIANTTTATGLKVKAKLNRRRYPTKTKVPEHIMKELALTPMRFHGEWNYKIAPRP